MGDRELWEGSLARSGHIDRLFLKQSINSQSS